MELGIKGHFEQVVTDALLAKTIGSGQVRVFATPMLLAGLEKAASESVQPFLGEGKTTVGTQVSLSHEAATPAGMQVRFETELTHVSENGKIFTFSLAAYDEAGLIGQGTHERALVSTARFEERAAAKRG